MVEIDLTTIFESYDVLPDDPKVLRHTNPGEVVFISKPIKAPFWFHESGVSYRLPEPQLPLEHEERVKIAVRLSNDGERWTKWDEYAVNTEGHHGFDYPYLYVNRYFRNTNREKLFKYIQFKITSISENQGKVLIKDLNIGFSRLSKLTIVKKSR
jgi:hypothetical protein